MPQDSFKLSTQQQQQQKLSPQMIQTLSLMSLPMVDLREKILEQVEINPALEIVRDPLSESPIVLHKNVNPDTIKVKDTMPYGSNADSDAFQSFLESAPNYHESLQEHLLSQLSFLYLTEEDKAFCEALIQNLNEYGYHIVKPIELLTALRQKGVLPFPKRDLSPLQAIEEDNEYIMQMLSYLQHFDPIGVACKDMQESLLIQCEEFLNVPELVRVLIEKCFSELDTPRPGYLQKVLLKKTDKEFSLVEIQQALDFIKTLNPYPAQEFYKDSVSYVSPDVIVRKSTQEEFEETGNLFVIELPKSSLPEITISKDFLSYIKESKSIKNKSTAEKNAIAQIENSIAEARSFIQKIEYRGDTIYKTVVAIFSRQVEFFKKGIRYLVPMKMKDIAEEIGVHETTISRAVNGKYIQCDWGIIEIRSLFTSGVPIKKESVKLQPTSSQMRSKESIKDEIKQIIEQSEKKLSDQKIVDKLAEKGIEIARRTVSKYRAELNINSSYMR